MKRSFYLFNPGIMERRDNTLKFTPVVVNEDNEEIKQQPRFIPIEDVAELYAFGSLRANSALFNFLEGVSKVQNYPLYKSNSQLE